MKKIFTTIGTLSAIAIPSAIVVSCGGDNENNSVQPTIPTTQPTIPTTQPSTSSVVLAIVDVNTFVYPNQDNGRTYEGTISTYKVAFDIPPTLKEALNYSADLSPQAQLLLLQKSLGSEEYDPLTFERYVKFEGKTLKLFYKNNWYSIPYEIKEEGYMRGETFHKLETPLPNFFKLHDHQHNGDDVAFRNFTFIKIE